MNDNILIKRIVCGVNVEYSIMRVCECGSLELEKTNRIIYINNEFDTDILKCTKCGKEYYWYGGLVFYNQ
jgi:hypothetical protein